MKSRTMKPAVGMARTSVSTMLMSLSHHMAAQRPANAKAEKMSSSIERSVLGFLWTARLADKHAVLTVTIWSFPRVDIHFQRQLLLSGRPWTITLRFFEGWTA
jgi:hypothetical protein